MTKPVKKKKKLRSDIQLCGEPIIKHLYRRLSSFNNDEDMKQNQVGR